MPLHESFNCSDILQVILYSALYGKDPANRKQGLDPISPLANLPEFIVIAVISVWWSKEYRVRVFYGVYMTRGLLEY